MKLLILLIATVFAENAPAWRSFLGAGESALPPDSIPLEWSPSQNLAWTTRLRGYGQSSPVIAKDRAYATTVEGPLKDRLIVSCVSMKDGALLWTREFPTSDPVTNGTFVSRAAPTPTVDEDGVYCFFESGDLIALSHSGDVRWQTSLSKTYGKFQNEYGIAASPMQLRDRLVLLIDHPGPSYLIAIDKSTGKELWKTDRTSRGSWSSPMLLQVAGETHVLCSSAGTIDGYDPLTGSQLWTFSGVGGNRICSPGLAGDGSFLVGSQTSREFADTDSVRKSNFLMRVSKHNAVWTPEVVWRTEDATPGMASPMVHGGCAYWVNRSGVIYCFDLQTGKSHYAQRGTESCWATPLGVGDRLYLFGKDGLTTVIAAGPEFRVLAENRAWDPDSVKPDLSVVEKETDPRRKAGAAMHTLPEVCGVAAIPGALLIRTGTDLFCIRRTESMP